MSTNARNIERLSSLGLTKYKLTFEEGHEYYRQMAKIKSFKNSDFLIGDEYGNLKVAINSSGDFVGFSAGQVLPGMTKAKALGGDAESKSVTVQFINRNQWDSDYTIFTSSQLGFDLIEIQSVNPAIVSFNEIPANNATVIKLVVKLASDNSTNVEGAVETNFLIQKNDGTSVVVSALSEANNVYSLTVPAIATGEIITAKLYTISINLGNIEISGVLFASNTASETVIA